MSLESEKGWQELHGLCLNKYGKLEPSSIDLDYYYTNDGGSFASDDYGRPGKLSNTASNVRLEVTSANVFLFAALQDRRGENHTSVDLNVNIENQDGRFRFEKQYVSDCSRSLHCNSHSFKVTVSLAVRAPAPSLWRIYLL